MPDSFGNNKVVDALRQTLESLLQLANVTEGNSELRNGILELANRTEQLITETMKKEFDNAGETDSQTILVVDDNEETREFIKQALLMTGYRVLEASNGEDALTIAKQSPEIHLVLSDVMLPGIKGPELLDRLRDMNGDIKAIFISGYIEEDVVSQDVEKVIASQVTFLQKPLSYRGMLEKIEEILNQ